MTTPGSRDQFVADTHALWWYLREPSRLSASAAELFESAEAGNATLIVPAIVLAESHWVSVKLGRPLPASGALDALARLRFEFAALGPAQLELLAELTEIPEMHDRLIAADAVIHDAPVVTRDRLIEASPRIETVW